MLLNNENQKINFSFRKDSFSFYCHNDKPHNRRCGNENLLWRSILYDQRRRSIFTDSLFRFQSRYKRISGIWPIFALCCALVYWLYNLDNKSRQSFIYFVKPLFILILVLWNLSRNARRHRIFRRINNLSCLLGSAALVVLADLQVLSSNLKSSIFLNPQSEPSL